MKPYSMLRKFLPAYFGWALSSVIQAGVEPIVDEALVFEESQGSVAIEAEHFHQQTLQSKRAWHIVSAGNIPEIEPDGDGAHLQGASGNAYLELLPDSRRNHGEKLIQGENFTNTPGKLAVLSYRVHFRNPGRYYVWVRAHSTGSEDNGIHVGLDGTWPESGQRMQWCEGKRTWRWESKQRTQEQHCGVPHQIYLDIEQAGTHTIMFSMREDGFEFDKFLMTLDRSLARPTDAGPEPRVLTGKLPDAFPPVVLTATTALEDTGPDLVQPRMRNGDGKVAITGTLRQWHKVTLTLNGPFANEMDRHPNPFTDHQMNVRFVHASGSPDYLVPGYFAADGDAANSSASAGVKWRAHVSPDKVGVWHYTVSFRTGDKLITGHDGDGEALRPYDGISGSFTIAPTNKRGRDFRGKGRLQYVGERYLRFAGTGEYFLKAGPDAPETTLAYQDFDGTEPGRKRAARSGEAAPTQQLKTWEPHVRDWNPGDPQWKQGKGKGLIGGLNYLASRGINNFSFLPYNSGGDGDNVWPFVKRMEKLHYDVSKLAQWEIVFQHGNNLGLHLHFKMQENEIDDNRRGHDKNHREVPESLDGGKLGIERKLYCRELIARFAHHLALNWNIGEESTQSTEEIIQMGSYIQSIDPYNHNLVIHTFPDQQDEVYTPLLGPTPMTGASLQNSWSQAHQRTFKWIQASQQAGKAWVVANDEQNPASHGVPPDIGYKGHNGEAVQGGKTYTMHDIRKQCLWGTLMAGGAGVEYYFGYQLPENDLVCEDWRSREQSWDYCRIALDFFKDHRIPFWAMQNTDALVGNAQHDNSKYCFSKLGDTYLVYLPKGGSTSLDLSEAQGSFRVRWFDPRNGGPLKTGSQRRVKGGGTVSLGSPPEAADQDWLILIR